MARQVIFDDEHVTVWYLDDKKIVHHKFHKFICGEPFRRALEAGTEALRRNGAQKWLSDDRANSALPRDDTEWAQTNWLPRTLAAGWKFWALVLPENVVGQMNMKRFARDYSQRGLIVQVFDDPDDALLWLNEQ